MSAELAMLVHTCIQMSAELAMLVHTCIQMSAELAMLVHTCLQNLVGVDISPRGSCWTRHISFSPVGQSPVGQSPVRQSPVGQSPVGQTPAGSRAQLTLLWSRHCETAASFFLSGVNLMLFLYLPLSSIYRSIGSTGSEVS